MEMGCYGDGLLGRWIARDRVAKVKGCYEDSIQNNTFQ